MTAPILFRRSILAITAAVFIPIANLPAADADTAAVAIVHQLVEGLVQVMKAGRATPFSQRFDMLAPVIDQTFDLAAILQASVGPTWNTLSQDQRAALLKSFRRYTIASYVSGFDENNEHFVISPETRITGNDQVVRTQIIVDSGEEHKLDHVMRRGPMGWRVVDVLVDGAISRVAVQRSDFRQLIRQGGAAALAASLETKSSDMSG